MGVPALVGTVYSGNLNTSPTVNVTITNGFTAGNSIVVCITQEQSTVRSVSSITFSAGSPTFTSVVISGKAGTAGDGRILICLNNPGLVAGGTLTITFSGTTTGFYRIQEVTRLSNPSLTDTDEDLSNTFIHECGATGLTTNGNVIIFACGLLSGTNAGACSAGTNYTQLGAALTRSMFQYRISASGLTADVGPWTNTGTARGHEACMAAFYDDVPVVGGAARPSINRYRYELGNKL